MILNKNEAVLLLGTNIGDRMAFLDSAKRDILQNIGPILKKSHIYESASWGYESKNNFLNQVLIVVCKTAPTELLIMTQKIESNLGKTSNSSIVYSDRPIDIDILFFGNQIVNTVNLTIPHPQIQNRRFTLKPLCDILPNLIHPVFNTAIKRLVDECNDDIKPSVYFRIDPD